jgi:uroporphyrinogen-III synthase
MAILITRPEADSLILKDYLGSEIKSFIFPTLQTKKLNPALHALNKNYQAVVFISKNSVDFGIDYLKKLNNCLILAVGKATAKRLEEFGYKVDFYPQEKPSSKSLLKIPQVAELKNKNILIFRGRGGVETLKNGFVKHNNDVDYLEVYDRVVNENADKYQSDLIKFSKQQQKIILITSCDILDGLLQLTKIDKKTHLLVISERIKKYATSLGFCNIILSRSISNQSIKEGLIKWLN